MAPRQFTENPDQTIEGFWDGAVLTSAPAFFAFPTMPFARISVRIQAQGERPGYVGPVGRLAAIVRSPGQSGYAVLHGTDTMVMDNDWYHIASQVGGLGDYMWAVPREEWPMLGVAFWSNGRAAGGSWSIRAFVI